MKKNEARTCQRVIWHVQWILLIIVMLFNIIGWMNGLETHVFIGVNGFSFALYFLLGQLEGYYECKSNCQI
ncbi:hypothetical protein [Bacillus sp. B15-48]|uniref:hypothetical protein n=1 Tax=Bacillus sp. B15-48 TaxID=1548601 RepID=UPI00193FC0FC|nr:hypothetical protein [Bacillus sp. B15-48]MBM4762967.1 hypothetical protein [Bacillus sp. B15-48]